MVTKDAVDRMIEKTDKLTVDENPFMKEEQPSQQQPILPAYQARKPNRDTQLWLGQVTRNELPRDYRVARDELADEAFMGRWDLVFNLLDDGIQRLQEQRINGARMSEKAVS